MLAGTKIVLAGSSDGKPIIMRLTGSAKPDGTFGVDGVAKLSGTTGWVGALSIDPQGRFVASGMIVADGLVLRVLAYRSRSGFAIRRKHDEGSLR